MKRKGMGTLFVLFLSAAAVPAGANPPAPPQPLPQPGQTIRIDGNLAQPDVRVATQTASPRVGDPDSDRFEERCYLQAPLSVTVMGTFDDVIVARHRTSSRPGDLFACADNGVLLLSRETWTALRTVEAAEARARAERERRRQAVRAIISGGARP